MTNTIMAGVLLTITAFAQSPEPPLTFTILHPKVTQAVLGSYNVTSVCTEGGPNTSLVCTRTTAGDKFFAEFQGLTQPVPGINDFPSPGGLVDSKGNVYLLKPKGGGPQDPGPRTYELLVADADLQSRTTIAEIPVFSDTCIASGNTTTDTFKYAVTPAAFFNEAARGYYLGTLIQVFKQVSLSGRPVTCSSPPQQGPDYMSFVSETFAVVKLTIPPMVNK